ncbi:alpha-ketoglutarate dependent xanthine dioxygenase [Cladochytrium replicatum]|nr:alpha-ketoglutarate dependent xanthine dioxygenase [Cladochytrium replicatum]
MTALEFVPLKHPRRAAKVNFGVEVHTADLACLSEEDFEQIKDAVFRHQVVVIKGQRDVHPSVQAKLTAKFDDTVRSDYGHGANMRKNNSVLAKDGVTIPEVPQVQVLGSNYLEHEHFGIPAGTPLHHPSHETFHATTLSRMDLIEGFTRFYRWHIDSALYDLCTPVVTSLYAIQVPKGARQAVRYDDGSDSMISVSLGTTAFVSGALALEAIPEDLRQLALHSKVRYAPHPYVWISKARANTTGLGMVCEGKELPLDQLPEWSEDKIKTLPMCWTNPVTGEKALMIHASCVEKLYLRSSDAEEYRVVDDLVEVRGILQQLMRPGIDPDRVLCHDWEEGDFVIFHNRGLWHTVVGQFEKDQFRLFHQCNLASGSDPQ